MRPSFHDSHHLRSRTRLAFRARHLGYWTLHEPLPKLEGQQLAKQAPHTHACVVIATTPNNVLFSLVISINWTIEREFHEARERDSAFIGNLSSNYFGSLIQLSGCGANLATLSSRRYGLIWRKSMLSLICCLSKTLQNCTFPRATPRCFGSMANCIAWTIRRSKTTISRRCCTR